MASDPSKNSRVRPGLAIGAGVMGAVTASIGIVTPAHAVDYPPWNDVQQAKANVAEQQAMIDNITSLIGSLQSSVDAARVASEKAAEAYFQAKDALEAATTKEADLKKQADAAEEKAKTSQMRAGLLASHLAKSAGGGDLSTELMLKGGGSGSDADKLLFQLGTMSKLTEQSKAVYDQATTDKNNAQSLNAQATVAKKEREALATKASEALAAAQQAQSAAQAALAEQQSKSTQLVAQLATLKNTSAQVEAAYLQGEQIKAQQKIDQAPPPKAPAVEAAEIRAASDKKIAQGEQGLEQQKAAADATIDLHVLELKERLAMLEYANRERINLSEVKSQLAQTAMKLQTQEKLNAVDTAADMHRHHNPGPVTKPPVQVPGRAADGQQFSQAS